MDTPQTNKLSRLLLIIFFCCFHTTIKNSEPQRDNTVRKLTAEEITAHFATKQTSKPKETVDFLKRVKIDPLQEYKTRSGTQKRSVFGMAISSRKPRVAYKLLDMMIEQEASYKNVMKIINSIEQEKRETKNTYSKMFERLKMNALMLKKTPIQGGAGGGGGGGGGEVSEPRQQTPTTDSHLAAAKSIMPPREGGGGGGSQSKKVGQNKRKRRGEDQTGQPEGKGKRRKMVTRSQLANERRRQEEIARKQQADLKHRIQQKIEREEAAAAAAAAKAAAEAAIEAAIEAAAEAAIEAPREAPREKQIKGTESLLLGALAANGDTRSINKKRRESGKPYLTNAELEKLLADQSAREIKAHEKSLETIAKSLRVIAKFGGDPFNVNRRREEDGEPCLTKGQFERIILPFLKERWGISKFNEWLGKHPTLQKKKNSNALSSGR